MGDHTRTARRNAVACWLLLLLTATIILAPQADRGTSTTSHVAFVQEQNPADHSVIPGLSNVDAPSSIGASYHRLPLAFEANQGQTDSRVKFLARGAGYTLFLTGEEAVLVLKPDANTEEPTADDVVLMKLLGANSQATVAGTEELPGRSNYFMGSDPEKWRTNVKSYAKVRYHDVYPGVDLDYYGKQGHLEYDLEVAPGADPGTIRLALTSAAGGVSSLHVTEDGDLALSIHRTGLRFHQPVIYQPSGPPDVESRTPVEGHYKLVGNNQISFELGRYDKSKPLVIDPALEYSTYLGGSQDDVASGIAIDRSSNVYVAGGTCSANFPIVDAVQSRFGGYTGVCSSSTLFGNIAGGDAFVVKLDPTLSRVLYSTYLGGGGDDVANGIAVNSSGNAFVTGSTCSSGASPFPTTSGVFQTAYAGGFSPCKRDRGDAFVTELSSSGAELVYSTYLGGASGDTANAIVVDSSDNAYVVGTTCSSNFPTTLGAIQTSYSGDGGKCKAGPSGDVFVAKLNSKGSALVYSTYLGGGSGDTGYALALDSSANAYVVGSTYSKNFPVTPGAYDTKCKGCATALSQAFVSKLNSTGTALEYSTYLGGSSGVEPCSACATGIAIDSSDNAYVVGLTSYKDFPILNAFQPAYATGAHDQFVTKLNSTGSKLMYSTFLGGAGDDGATAIAVDTLGNAYVRGNTNSTNFPTTPDAFQVVCSGGCPVATYDVTLSVLASSGGSLIYGTYLGGSQTDFAKAAQTLVLANGADPGIYLTGLTNSTDFPVTTNAYQKAEAGGYDAFVTKFGFASNVSVSPSTLNFGSQKVQTAGPPQTITFSNVGEIALSLHSIKITGADAADFKPTTTCTATLMAETSCSIAVTFKPSATGTRSATLVVSDNGGNSPQQVSLTGSGT